ncbi:uncharacterized protein LOC141630143 [Silene latifolia]|uniref:uncharacterized protein LOC141630143 n=1 Tax=Silene latifolia TaxID=37657 RepID=UPI003D76F262
MARKRKCSTDVVDYIVPEMAKESLDNAKEYLRQLAKRSCAGEGLWLEERKGAIFRFFEVFGVDAVGASGGVGGMEKEAKMSLVKACKNFMVLLVRKYDGLFWYLVLFYGAPELHLRSLFVLSDLGANEFINWKIRNELIDIPFKGPRYTWCNNRKGEKRVYERLDKALASKDWLIYFPNSGIKHYPVQISDHAPIELDLHLTESEGKRPYKMDAWVLDHEECMQGIRASWNLEVVGSPAFRVVRKLARVRTSAKKWALDKRKEWRQVWDEFDKGLVDGLNVDVMGGGDELYSKANEEVKAFARATAVFWKQRAKMRWMVDGDTCTKFFFNWVKGRKGRNYIHGIKGEDGVWSYDHNIVSTAFQRNFMALHRKIFGDSGISRVQEGIFDSLIDYVSKRISSWNGIYLSPAGRLTLISSVLSNLSNYFLSVFKIPVSVSSKLNSLLAQFWWAGCKLGQKLHWCSKNFLSLPKSSGGLGIRNVGCLNKALLAKQGWRLVSGEDSYFSRIFRRRIFGSNSYVDGATPTKGLGCSWGVRSIRYGLELILDNIGWKPGWDSGLNAWNAKWVNGNTPEPQDRLLGSDFLCLGSLQVRDLWNRDLSWNAPLVCALFKEQDVRRILASTICKSRKQDGVFWPFTNDGGYSVKSGYGIAFREFFEKKGTIKDKARISMRGRGFCKSRLWSLPGPSSWKMLIWKIITKARFQWALSSRSDQLVGTYCQMCSGTNLLCETVEHVFRDCALAARV